MPCSEPSITRCVGHLGLAGAGVVRASRADGEAMRGCARAVRVGMRAGMVSSSVFRRLEPLW